MTPSCRPGREAFCLDLDNETLSPRNLYREPPRQKVENLKIDEQTRKAAVFVLIAFGILCALGLTLLFSALTFAARWTLSWIQFPLAFTCAMLANFLAARFYFPGSDAPKVFIKVTGVIVLLFVISSAVAFCFYDISWDGQAYHQETVIQLKEGWNPFYGYVPDSVAHSTLVNHFAKGVEIVQAAIYVFVGRIEAGKATNLLLMFASFFLVLSFLSTMDSITAVRAFLISSLFALNPVVMNQALTYYVDGPLGSLLLCLLALSCYLMISIDRLRLLLFGAIIMVTVTVKFTAVVYAAILVGGLLILLCCKRRFDDLKKILAVAVLAAAIGILFAGFNPYVTNIMHRRHPFFPVAGKERIDIMIGQRPLGLAEKNRFEKLFLSTFSSGEAPWPDRKPRLKVPFTLNRDEFLFSMLDDLRVAGFGPLFGGAVLLAAALLVSLATLNRTNRSANRLCLYVLSVLLLSVLSIPETWWARFVPQFWFFPLIILCFAEHAKDRRTKYLRALLYVTLVANVTVISVSLVQTNTRETANIRRQLTALKATHKTVSVDFGPFQSHRIRYKENGIPYVARRVE